jgi:hypothetical protein
MSVANTRGEFSHVAARSLGADRPATIDARSGDIDLGAPACKILAMQLERCRDQAPQTIEEFYQWVASSDGAVSHGGSAMLDLIARLRAAPDARRAWGLTSHTRLCLLASDTHTSPWYVIVSALDHRNFNVEYLMPSSLAPWPHARVTGEAQTVEEAVRKTFIAMERCEGWARTETPG